MKTPSRYFLGPPQEFYSVVVLIGSDSDQKALDDSGMLKVFDMVGINYHQSQVSAHRHETALRELCLEAINDRHTLIFIGIAGMVAALSGAIASVTKQSVPVLGVGLDSGFMDGLDAMLSISRMPKGVPVAFMGIGSAGLVNAAIFACQILSAMDKDIEASFLNYRAGSCKEPKFGVHYAVYRGGPK